MTGSLNSIVVNDLQVAYLDTGRGPPVILSHCSSASHKEWLPLIEILRERYRVLTPDLIGYGRSDRWPKGRPFDPFADVNILLALAEIAAAPVHLAAHSYGGAVSLEAARLLGPRVQSLTLVEPVAFQLLRLAGRTREWAEVSRVAQGIRAAIANDNERRAAAVYMGFWVGRVRWWLMPRRLRRNILATVGKVSAEFGIMDELSSTLADYAAITAPTRLIAGSRTRKPARAVTDLLTQILPDAHLCLIPGAGHMSPFTHAQTVSALIAEHIDRR